MDQGKQTLIELWIGIGICACIFLIPGFFLKGYCLPFILGIISGAVIAAGLAAHMYRSLSRALELPEEKAAGYTRRMSLLRLLLLAVVLMLGAAFGSKVQLAAMLLGVLSLKFSAYLQPLTHKYIFNKFFNKGR